MDITEEVIGHYKWLIGSLLKEVPSETVVFAPLDGKVGGYSAQEFMEAMAVDEMSEVKEVALVWVSDMMRAVRDMLIRRARREDK